MKPDFCYYSNVNVSDLCAETCRLKKYITMSETLKEENQRQRYEIERLKKQLEDQRSITALFEKSQVELNYTIDSLEEHLRTMRTRVEEQEKEIRKSNSCNFRSVGTVQLMRELRDRGALGYEGF